MGIFNVKVVMIPGIITIRRYINITTAEKQMCHTSLTGSPIDLPV